MLGGTPATELPVQEPERLLVVLNTRTIERAELDFDRLMLDFVDVIVD